MHGALWVLLLSGILGFPRGDARVSRLAGRRGNGAGRRRARHLSARQYFLHLSHAVVDGAAPDSRARASARASSEITLSLVVSGVQGMLTFQALALFVYALSRDVLLAVGAAALIFFTRSAEYGTVYPLFLLGTEHTYGVVGLSTGVLVVALLGAGWYRTGALLLGIAPCIHPALGSWTGADRLRLPCSRTFAGFASSFARRCRGFSRLRRHARQPADPVQPRAGHARRNGAAVSRRSLDVRQALGRTSRGRQHLAQRRDAERRVARRRVGVARRWFG